MEAPPRGRSGFPAWAISTYLSRGILKGWFARLVFWLSFAPLVVLSAVMYFASRRPDGTLRLINSISGSGFRDLESISDDIWYRLASNAVFWLMGMFQGWFALLITAFAGSAQIADDLRSHAFEVYLARPIAPWEYFAGKVLVVLRPLLLITAVPCLLFLAVANLLFPGSFQACVPLYLYAAAGCLLMGLLHSVVILGISSLGKSARYATIIWFALYFVTFIAQQVLVQNTQNPTFDLVSYRANLQIILAEVLELLPYENIEMDLPAVDRSIVPSVLILALLAAASILLVFRRLKSGRLP
jgi:ABC-type transport system involved in multi-copper enzyme maturation permease subunit